MYIMKIEVHEINSVYHPAFSGPVDYLYMLPPIDLYLKTEIDIGYPVCVL